MASLLSDQVAATRTNTHPALNNSFPSRHGDGRPTTGSTAAQSPPGHTEAMDGASMSAAASWATAVGGGVPLRAPERLLPAKETDGASAAVEYPLSVTYDESVLSITGLKYPPYPPYPRAHTPRPHPAIVLAIVCYNRLSPPNRSTNEREIGGIVCSGVVSAAPVRTIGGYNPGQACCRGACFALHRLENVAKEQRLQIDEKQDVLEPIPSCVASSGGGVSGALWCMGKLGGTLGSWDKDPMGMK